MSGSIRRVLQERPRLDLKRQRQRFQGRHVDPLQWRTGDKSRGGRLRQTRECGELVGVREAASFHVASEVPADHVVTIALLPGLDKW